MWVRSPPPAITYGDSVVAADAAKPLRASGGLAVASAQAFTLDAVLRLRVAVVVARFWRSMVTDHDGILDESTRRILPSAFLTRASTSD